MSRSLGRLLACAGLVLIISAYGCDVGHGFVKDDFGWILSSRGWTGFFDAPTGFFRPVVSLSFAVDHALFGVQPFGYGLTNLAILLACTVTIAALLRALGVGTGLAIAGAILWTLNFQGINMAVLWISGRTALLLTFWSAACAWAWLRGARFTSAALATLAMGSKEEAFVLPAILTVWALLDPTERERAASTWRRVWHRTWPLWMVALLCLGLRMRSGAMTPATAPAFYRYQFDLATLAVNTISYLDRVGTTPVLALVLFWLMAGRPRLSAGPGVRRRAVEGFVWVILGFAPTILLPVRSSLYAVMPSIGVVIILAAIAEEFLPRTAPASLKRGALVMTAIFFVLLPVYRARNQRYVSEAKLSRAIVEELSSIGAAGPAGGLVVIRDVRTGRPTAEQAFGPGASGAAELATDGKIRVWIDPAPAELATATLPDLSQAIAVLTVEAGTVRRTR